MKAHDLDTDDVDDKDEIDDDEQLCLVWCRAHRSYEWHWLELSRAALAARRRRWSSAE